MSKEKKQRGHSLNSEFGADRQTTCSLLNKLPDPTRTLNLNKLSKYAVLKLGVLKRTSYTYSLSCFSCTLHMYSATGLYTE